MLKPFIYPFLKAKLAFTLSLFFKKIWVQGGENIPNGPIIFAVNHQNSFLDALLVTVTTRRDPYYLARGDVFGNRLANRLLNFINILPIYRSNDGLSKLKRNEHMFHSCVQLLKNDKAIIIFPEAHHEYEYRLRPIRKGIARLAMIAHDAGLQEIQIVPVGIQYEYYYDPGHPVVVSYGKPIPVATYVKKDDLQMTYRKICDEVASGMAPLIVNIPQSNYDEMYRKWQANRNPNKDAILQLKKDQQLVAEIEATPSTFPSDSTKHQTNKWYLWPFFAVSSLLFLLPLILQRWLIKAVKDDQYIASIKVASWYFFIPEILVLEGALVYLLFQSSTVLFSFLGLSVISGWITIKRYFPL